MSSNNQIVIEHLKSKQELLAGYMEVQKEYTQLIVDKINLNHTRMTMQ